MPASSTARRHPGRRPEWRIARWNRRYPGIALWVLVFALVGLPAAQQGLSKAEWFAPEPAETGPEILDDPVLLENFTRAVNDALIEIGHSVRVDKVLVAKMGRSRGAYDSWDNTIYVSGAVSLDDNDLLHTAAHECVHAMFAQAYLDRYAYLDPDHALRVEETTAYVLGAHIAGAMLNRRGGDGARLLRDSLEGYRAQCDPRNPVSRHREARRMRDTMHIDGHDPVEIRNLEVHFWSPWLVDEIDKICRANPDPWDAAYAVAKKYRLID